MRTTNVFAYRLPRSPSEVGGYWLGRAVVEPLEVTPLGDLVRLHEDAGIELRVLDNLWPLWNEAVSSTLGYMRLRNAQPAK